MKASAVQERLPVQLDPSAFLADADLIRALSARAIPVPCDEVRILFRQDEPAEGLYIVYGGAVTLSVFSHDGHSLFAAQAKPGSLLGLPGVVSDQPYTLSATASAGAEVSFVARADFTALMQADPKLALKILQVLAAEVRSARKAIY